MLARAIEGTRRNPRYVAHLGTVFEIDGRYDHGTILSLSQRGCFLATDATPRVGSTMGVAFQVPDAARVKTVGVVIYRSLVQGHAGVGLRFAQPAALEETVDAIRSWHEEYCWGDGFPD